MSIDERYEAWINHADHEVRVSPAGLGVPTFAVASSDGTIGGTYFDTKLYSGPLSFQEACTWAETEATRFHYLVEHWDPFYDLSDGG